MHTVTASIYFPFTSCLSFPFLLFLPFTARSSLSLINAPSTLPSTQHPHMSPSPSVSLLSSRAFEGDVTQPAFATVPCFGFQPDGPVSSLPLKPSTLSYSTLSLGSEAHVPLSWNTNIIALWWNVFKRIEARCKFLHPTTMKLYRGLSNLKTMMN